MQHPSDVCCCHLSTVLLLKQIDALACAIRPTQTTQHCTWQPTGVPSSAVLDDHKLQNRQLAWQRLIVHQDDLQPVLPMAGPAQDDPPRQACKLECVSIAPIT